MTPSIASSDSADHYLWGGPAGTDCDGWHLVRTPSLSVIEERMPPGTQEVPHFHRHARQFFYVLQGRLTLHLDDATVVLSPGKGLEIAPGLRHQAVNPGPGDTRFLVISQPPSHGDRVISAP